MGYDGDMPPPSIRSTAARLADAAVHAIELALERIGDPGRSVADDLLRRRLVEATEEVEGLERENRTLREWHDRDAEEVMRLRGMCDERQIEIETLRGSLRTATDQMAMYQAFVDRHTSFLRRLGIALDRPAADEGELLAQAYSLGAQALIDGRPS